MVHQAIEECGDRLAGKTAEGLGQSSSRQLDVMIVDAHS